MTDWECKWDPESFAGTISERDGKRILKVTGQGVCPSAGYSASLDYGNAGINPQPNVLVLQLSETPPASRDDKPTPTEAVGEFEIDDETPLIELYGIGNIIAKEDGHST